MNTGRTWQTESSSLEDTLRLGGQIGHRLRGGEAIELVSDLGGGKTAFVRGLARGIGSRDAVRSPSFTIANQYRAGDLTLHHFDFYRLAQPGIMAEELAEILSDGKAVVVVEWADIVQNVLPDRRLTINLKIIAETDRGITFRYPKNLDYLLPNEDT